MIIRYKQLAVLPDRCSHIIVTLQSFHAQGFASTHLFERAGPIADPMYHNSGELSSRISILTDFYGQNLCIGDLSDREGYDFDQLKSLAKIQVILSRHP